MKNYLIVLIVGVLISFGSIYSYQRIKNLKQEVVSEQLLRNALTDTMKVYKNKYNEVVSEKLTIQASMKQLQDENLVLNKNQKELIKRVKETDKSKQVIAAALIEQKVVIDSLGLVLKNKQYVSFQWDKRNDKPISFSITNSNPLFQTTNIESYAIPELNKDKIKPNFWHKVGNGIKNGGSTGIKIGVGIGIGYLIFK